MRSKKTLIIVISILAFAAVVYFLSKGSADPDGKGLRRLKVETIKADSGWGYRIRDNETPIIEQLSVPGIAGNKGFKDEQSALKTGRLVEQKLLNGIFPPTVSAGELDSLKVSY